MGRKSERPRVARKPSGSESPRAVADPQSYLQQRPVWRFSDFDWDGGWGISGCATDWAKFRSHVEDHLSSFETMTWGEILKASGGRSNGNNSHDIARDKFTRGAQDRLKEKGILADSLFSLRLDAGTRIYGVREGNCLRIVFFDPFHKDKLKCAYDYG